MKVRDVIAVLEKHGFELARHRGDHRRFVGVVDGRTRMVTVPGALGADIPKGTLAAIRRQSGLRHAVLR